MNVPPANLQPLFDLSRNLGPQGNFARALAALQVQDAQLTTAMQVANRLTQTPAGESYLRWQTMREGKRAEATGEAQLHGDLIRAAHYATPQAQASTQRQFQTHGAIQTVRLRMDAQQAEQQAAYLRSPVGQHQLQAQHAATVRQTLAQTHGETAMLQAHAAHLQTPVGVADAGRQLDANARLRTLTAQMQAAHALIAVEHQRSPQGAAQQQQTLMAQTVQATAQSQQQATQAQQRAEFLRTPVAQQQLQVQYGAGLETRTAEVQQQTAQTRAQAEYLATPQGRQEYRAGLMAQAQQKSAETAVARQQQIAQYGQLGSAVMQAKSAFAAMNPYVAAARVAFGEVLALAGKASPNTTATYAGSVDLLQAKIGSLLIPAIEAAAGAAQRFASYVPDPGSRAGRFISGGVSLYGDVFTNPKSAIPFIGPALSVYEHFFGDDKAAKLRSMAGLQGGPPQTIEQSAMSSGMASLNMGPLESELLRIQMENLTRVMREDVELRRREGRSYTTPPGWRE